MKSLVVLILVVMGSMATACYASETGSAVTASVQRVSTAVTSSAPVVLTDTELTNTVGTSDRVALKPGAQPPVGNRTAINEEEMRNAKNRDDIAKKTSKRNTIAVGGMRPGSYSVSYNNR